MKKNNNFYQFIEKIGTKNFALVIFLLIVFAITSLYSTFSMYTASSGLSLIDGLKTYKFILGKVGEKNSIIIAANSSKNVAITITNPEEIELKYGLSYSSQDDLTNVDLGYLKSSEHKATGIIEANQKYVVNLKIENNSNANVTLDVFVNYGLSSGGDLILEQNQQWFLEKYDVIPLNEVTPGSYVTYIGNNGCEENNCSGENANYISETEKGFCKNPDYQFDSDGWRVAYTKDNTAYLISAGSPECLATDETGMIMNEMIEDYETTLELPNHLKNLNITALKYCNEEYAYDGICNENSAWSISSADFEIITKKPLFYNSLNDNSCFNAYQENSCGQGVDLINTGGYYWISSFWNETKIDAFMWNPTEQVISADKSNQTYGLRPVLRMDDSVVVVKGTGTYEDPYQLKNTANRLK